MLPNQFRRRLVLLSCLSFLVLLFLVLLSCGDLVLRGLDGQARVGSLYEDLVLHYPFDGTATDASGNGYDGTLDGAYSGFNYTQDRFSNASAAASFTDPSPPNPPTADNFGDPSYMDSGWGASLELDSAYTINLWIRGYSTLTPPPDVAMHLFGVASTAGFPYLTLSLNVPAAGGLTLSIGGGAMPTTHFDTASFNGPFDFVNQEIWTMITAIHEAGFGASRLGLYIDGLKQTPDSTTSDMDPQDNLTLGASLYLAASHSFTGAFNEMHELVCDDVRIYNRALTKAEIKALYHESGWMQ
jgi:hypothetical protein